MLWLKDQGHRVVGVELSEIAVESFCMENGIPARRQVRGEFDIYETPELRLYRGDFFALTRTDLEDVVAVYDRAALISWTPELRSRYVEHLSALVNARTQMLLVTVEYPQAQMAGPPFALMYEEVAQLYLPHFTLHEIDRQDVLANEPRLRARGVLELFEVTYQLIRR
jgi:thiopurine S-methyltransferase